MKKFFPLFIIALLTISSLAFANSVQSNTSNESPSSALVSPHANIKTNVSYSRPLDSFVSGDGFGVPPVILQDTTLLECPDTSIFGQQVHLPSDSWSAATSDANATTPYKVWESYTVSGQVCDIHWWGFMLYFTGTTWTECYETASFDIEFYPDDGTGMPDTANPVCTYLGVVPIQDTTGFRYHSTLQLPLWRFDVENLVPCCTLQTGWISIQGSSVGSPDDCWFLWQSSGTGDGDSWQWDGTAMVLTGYDRSVCLTGIGSAILGACCNDNNGACIDNVTHAQCPTGSPGVRWTANTLCADLTPPCGTLFGACCDDLGDCTQTEEQDCPGTWYVDTPCDPNPCPPPCSLDCPVASTPEGEPDCYDGYIDVTNGGCNSDPPVFGSISAGETVCGTGGTFDDGGQLTRDTDWLEFTVTEEKNYTLTASAEFPVIIGIVVPGEDNPAEPCSVTYVSYAAQGDPCDTISSTAFLGPGNFGYYWVFVATQTGITATCGSKYWITLTESLPPEEQEFGLATTAQIPDCGVSNYGPLGDQDYQGNTYGWNGNPAANYGGTFVMGNSDTTVFAYYGPDQSNCLHVRPAGPLDMTDTYHPSSNYDDNGIMGGIAVNYCGHGFETVDSDSGDIFIHVFTISNNGLSTVSNLYAGVYFDWDINTTQDTVILDRTNKLISMGGPRDPLRYGAALVNNVPLSSLTGVSQWDYIYPTGPSGGGWNQDDLYTLMSSGVDQIADSFYTDMSMLLSTGPYTLNPDDTIDVQIAVIGASSNLIMIARALLAQSFDIPRCVVLPPAGCDYVPGDVNGSSSYNGLDITYGVAYFKGGNDPLCTACPIPECNDWNYCGDVNGSCSYNGLDITYGVAYFKGGSAPIICPDCPPVE